MGILAGGNTSYDLGARWIGDGERIVALFEDQQRGRWSLRNSRFCSEQQ